MILRGALQAFVSCPHCCSISTEGRPTCHLCHGGRRVSADSALAYARHIWAKPGCVCGACALIGPMPGRTSITNTGPNSSTARAEVGATLPRATGNGWAPPASRNE